MFKSRLFSSMSTFLPGLSIDRCSIGMRHKSSLASTNILDALLTKGEICFIFVILTCSFQCYNYHSPVWQDLIEIFVNILANFYNFSLVLI